MAHVGKEVPGQRSIIRLGEPTKRHARAISRRFALGAFRHASPRGSQNHSVVPTHAVAAAGPSQVHMPQGIQILDPSYRGPPIDVSTVSSDAVRTAHSQQLFNAPGKWCVQDAPYRTRSTGDLRGYSAGPTPHMGPTFQTRAEGEYRYVDTDETSKTARVPSTPRSVSEVMRR